MPFSVLRPFSFYPAGYLFWRPAFSNFLNDVVLPPSTVLDFSLLLMGRHLSQSGFFFGHSGMVRFILLAIPLLFSPNRGAVLVQELGNLFL